MRAEALLAQAQRALAAAVAGEHGVLSLAASGNPGNYLLPPVLARFHDELPGVEINYRLGNSARVEESVQEHLVELGIVGGASALPGSSRASRSSKTRSFSSPNRNSPDGAPHAESWKDSCGSPARRGSATRSIAEEARRQLGVSVRRSLELPSWEAIKTAVASGGGVGALSRYAITAELKAGTLANDIPNWQVRRLISAVRARDVPLTPAAERFLSLLRRHSPHYSPPRAAKHRRTEQPPAGPIRGSRVSHGCPEGLRAVRTSELRS